ncbi:MAG: YybH family protein, partial [bacterium]
MMRAATCLPALLAAVVACQAPDTSAAAKAAIDAANANWPRLTSSGHADSLAEFYAADGMLMPPNMPTVRGKDSIRAFFAVLNEAKPTLTIRAETVIARGDVAVERGRWVFTWAPGTVPPGAPASDSGKYIVRWT